MPNGYFRRELPEKLADLADLAMDLRWTTSQLTRGIWERLEARPGRGLKTRI